MSKVNGHAVVAAAIVDAQPPQPQQPEPAPYQPPCFARMTRAERAQVVAAMRVVLAHVDPSRQDWTSYWALQFVAACQREDA